MHGQLLKADTSTGKVLKEAKSNNSGLLNSLVISPLALSCSMSPCGLPPRLLCAARTDTFENWFSATLSNLEIIYTNCLWESILNRHRCHGEERGEVLGAMGVLSHLDWSSSSYTANWKIFLLHGIVSNPFLYSSSLPGNSKTIPTVSRLYPKKKVAIHASAYRQEQL